MPTLRRYWCDRCQLTIPTHRELDGCRKCAGPLVLRDRGLGDTVERVIKAVTLGLVKPCGGCENRRDSLNALVPYEATPKPGDNPRTDP